MTAPLRISMAGTGALLLDGGGPVFDPAVQRRVWSVARACADLDCVDQAAPGMNNLLVTFDPLRTEMSDVERALRTLWADVVPQELDGRVVKLPVMYGGPDGEDLAGLARHAGMSIDEVVRRHSGATYWVGAIGAMPGYPYMFGLDPALAWGRRATPKARVEVGAVLIGGVQAAVMTCATPTGWHVIGRTEVLLFDPGRDEPCLLRAGDVVRFTVAGVLA